MYHGDGNTQERENQQAISAAFFQTLCNSTQSNWENEPALPSMCGANVQVTWVQGGKLRSCVCLHRLPPANRITRESSGCFALVDGVDKAGLSLAATCLHISSGKGSHLPWFLPLSPSLGALKARKVCQFEVIHVNISNSLSALESAISLA